MNDTAKLLDMAFHTNKNCILWGKGGHGKSEFTCDFFRDKGIDPYVFTMGTGTTTDRLFGGIDLKLFNETGKIEYLVENSFMNFEYVVFEELFDAPDYILEQLKDILSSKVFRNGNQIFEIKTKLIICNTNKSREQFAKNDSLKALMERFPLEQEVKWKEYNNVAYTTLLKKVFNTADPMLIFLLTQYAKKGKNISPRIAILAQELLIKCGPDCLNFIAEFSSDESLFKDCLSKFKSFSKAAELSEEINKLVDSVRTFIKKEDLYGARQNLNLLISKNSELSRLKCDDDFAVEVRSLINKYSVEASSFSSELEILEAEDKF